MRVSKQKIIEILQQILKVEDIEVKNCAIESLIDMLEDMEMHETTDREGSE